MIIMNGLENQIKEFLVEVCDKYKNYKDCSCVRLMIEEYENYLLPKINELDLLSTEMIMNLTDYAVELSNNFEDEYIKHSFWYNFGYILRL